MREAFTNLRSLNICNNEKLKVIEIEDGNEGEDTIEILHAPLLNVETAVIKSIVMLKYSLYKPS